jgi:hypothetical protein
MLSKSKLLAFRRCPKWLWLEIHKPELRTESAATLARLRTGFAVGEAAKRIYDPDGLGAIIDIDREGFDGALARSADLLTHSRLPIFEAGFAANGLLAFADVMLPVVGNGEQMWKLVEIKSSTSVKDYHRDDIAVQAFIARSAGVRLHSVILAHVDGSWVYPGNGDYCGLLKEHDLTAEVFARCDEVRGWIDNARKIGRQAEEPEVAVGSQCHDPFDCGFCACCHGKLLRAEYPLEWLPDLTAAKLQQFAQQGFSDLQTVPDEILTAKQRIVKKHTLAKTAFFDAAGAVADLAGHGSPAYFLDFETIQFRVPIWEGTRPYQQIAFQFSLHRLNGSEEMSHSDFLDLSGNNPSEPLARALVSDCGDEGPVFVYNAPFEKSRICEMAERHPDLARQLMLIHARIVDLLPVARNRYYHPGQEGSWSLKAVLPTLPSALDYAGLDGVNDGGAAMDAYSEAIRPDTGEERRRTIQSQLLAYCRLDTYALVNLWCFLTSQKPPGLDVEAVGNPAIMPARDSGLHSPDRTRIQAAAIS